MMNSELAVGEVGPGMDGGGSRWRGRAAGMKSEVAVREVGPGNMDGGGSHWLGRAAG